MTIKQFAEAILQITGSKTGAANGFGLSGLGDLVYDPTNGTGTLQATARAADATYTIGGVSRTSPTNESVPVASGVVASFTATGPMTLSSPIGQSNASGAAETLVSDFNALISADPTSASTTSSGHSTLTQILDKIAGQSVSTQTGTKSLADLGITVGTDGSLAIDQAKLTSAYSADPAGFNAVITQTAAAVKTTLSSNNGVAEQVKSSVGTLMSQLVHIPTLVDVLSGNSTSAGGSSNSAVASQILSGFSA